MALSEWTAYASVSAATVLLLLVHTAATIPQLAPLAIFSDFLHNKVKLMALVNLIWCLMHGGFKLMVKTFMGQLSSTELGKVRDSLTTPLFSKPLFILYIWDFGGKDDENNIGPDLFVLACWLSTILLLTALEVCVRSRVDRVCEEVVAGGAPSRELALSTAFSFCCQGINFVSLVCIVWLFSGIGIHLILFLILDMFVLAIRFGGSLARCLLSWYKLVWEPAWSKFPHFLQITTLSFDLAARYMLILQTLQIWIHEGVHFSLVDFLLFSQANSNFRASQELRKRIQRALQVRKSFEENLSRVNKEDLKENNSCPICIDEMNESNSRKLHCGHIFHMDCIQRWLCTKESTRKCPVCRCSVFPDDSSRSGGSSAPEPNSASTGSATSASDTAENSRRRTIFRFDTGRDAANQQTFFGWLLPGVLSGMSIQIQSHDSSAPPAAAPERISGVSMEAAIDRVLEVIPQARRDDVRRELQRTRSIDVAANNLFERGIPTTAANDQGTDSSDTSSTSSSETSVDVNAVRRNILRRQGTTPAQTETTEPSRTRFHAFSEGSDGIAVHEGNSETNNR
eukprot:gb/GECG01000728.1/.p1 GENE.gb/GECG01000728.1/~~gb/GECG01000728.1/.p1  ORF type:complete len:569 (+),score=47.89 gb/GECG01000728.1/:1-1707(+)